MEEERQPQQQELGEELSSSETPRSHSPVQHSLVFPAARIKRLVKLDKGSVSSVSSEGLSMISRATECFVEALGRSAGAVASAGGRRTVVLKDLAEAVRRDDRFQFTHDLIPLAIPFEEAVRNQQQQQPLRQPIKNTFFAKKQSTTSNNAVSAGEEEDV